MLCFVLKKEEIKTEISSANQVNKQNKKIQKKGANKKILSNLFNDFPNQVIKENSDMLRFYSTHRFFYGYLVST